MRGDDDGREIGCDLKARRDASTAIDAIRIREGHAEGHDVWHDRDVTGDTRKNAIGVVMKEDAIEGVLMDMM